MVKTIKIDINPQILEWAREEAGYETPEIAKRLGIPPDRYDAWEKTGKDIPLGKMKDLAKSYRRQLAVFFLSEPPPKVKLPEDYRNLSDSEKPLSRQTRLTIRRSSKFIDLAIDLKGESYWQSRCSWLPELEKLLDQKEIITETEILNWLRKKIKISIDHQKKFKSSWVAFNEWRRSVEQELGIFIFQFPMPMDEIHGFCLAERVPYAIVINSRHSPNGKIFTIFHEIAHIFRHESGICLPDLAVDEGNHEFDCNRFSAKFLIPDKYVNQIKDIEELKIFAKKFKVSSEVYLRRNFELNLITPDVFFTILKQLRSHPFKPKGGPVKPIVKSLSRRGEMFFNLIMDAALNNKINFNTASDALELSFNYITNG